MPRKKKITTDAQATTGENLGTNPEVKPEPGAPKADAAAAPKQSPQKKDDLKATFIMAIIAGFSGEMDAADIAAGCNGYAKAMVALADGNLIRNQLAGQAIKPLIRIGELYDRAAIQAFKIADEILKTI